MAYNLSSLQAALPSVDNSTQPFDIRYPLPGDSQIPGNSQNNQPPAPRPNSLRPDIVQQICSSSPCDQVGSKKCGRCQTIYYCSPECQKKHWPVHKIACKALETPAQNQPVEDTSNPLLFATSCRNNGLVRPDKLASLRQQGYQGLKNVNLEEIIASKGYNEALKYIWTENDYSHRMKVLLPFAKDSHPLLMLELSQAFALCAVAEAKKNNQLVLPVEEFFHPTGSSIYPIKTPLYLQCSFNWYALAHLCMNIDIQCLKSKDNMLVEPLQKDANILLKQYNPAWHIEENARPVTHFDILCDRARTAYSEWKFSSKNPSPRWIIDGTSSPEKDWLKIRNQIKKTVSSDSKSIIDAFAAIRVGGSDPRWDKEQN